MLADEVDPHGALRWLLHWVVRLPLVVLTYLITQATTRPLRSLPDEVRGAGFAIESVHLNGLMDFIELVAYKLAIGSSQRL